MKKTRKCTICKCRFEPKFDGLAPVCLDPKCIIAYSKIHREKERLKADKKRKAEIREWKKEATFRLKKHGDVESELQHIINKITAIIDKGMNCICCDSPITKFNPANAGHRFAIGGNNSLRFNLHNIHRNGVCCNKHKSGNADGYDEGLVTIYGSDYFNYVKHELKGLYPLVKLSKEELEEKKKVARQIIRELEKLDMTYPPKVRIELRNKYNELIGIYLQNYL